MRAGGPKRLRGLGAVAAVTFAAMLGTAPALAAPSTAPPAAAGAGPAATRVAAAGPVLGRRYEIVNRYHFDNRACLDAFESGGGVAGNRVGLFHCTGGRTQKWWVYRNPESSAYPLKFVNDVNRLLCLTENGTGYAYTLEVCSAGSASQSFTTQAAIPGGTYILWYNDPVGDGDILADAFGSECCHDGMSVGNWWFTNSDLQRWDFVPT
jgi:hypothetical protein